MGVNAETTSEQPRPATQSFEKYTDSQLSAAASNFERLSAADRRILLTELRKRMSEGRPLKGRIRIEQQFGSIEAREDGTIVRVNVSRRMETSKPVRQTLVQSTSETIENNSFGSVNGESADQPSVDQSSAKQVDAEDK